MASNEARLERVLEAIASAMTGDYDNRVPLAEVEDPLLEVEVGINYLLDDLALRQRENQAQTQAMREQAERIQTQARSLIAALSTPIITLWPGVLILPLIGDFDRERAERTTAVLLERVANERARYVILDLTGIESISTDTAHSLLRMTRAGAMLGVTCLVTGILPQAASQLVALDADISHLRTFSRVSEALEVVLGDARIR